MRENTANSVAVSLAIHAFVAGAIFLATYFVSKQVKEAPVIFELVAGDRTEPGDHLEAPPLGSPDQPVKLEVPIVETVPTVADEPPAEVPVVQTQPEEPAPTPPAPTPEKVKTPTKAVEKVPEKPKSNPKPKPPTSLANAVKQSQRISYKDYLKKHPTPKAPAVKAGTPGKAATGPRIDTAGIANGVRGSTSKSRSGEGGTALTREQQDQMSTYISMLIQELKKAHEPPPGVSDRLEARVTFDITASGAILNPRISKSSGDKAFDDSVIEAFLRMHSIGPTPNRRSDTWTVTFRMRDES